MDGYGKRVLLADDDEAIRALICSILTDAGYNVYAACDGLEAVDLLKKRRYDVLLTDYHMPKMDGLELLDLAQAMWPDLPVIVATSDALFDRADLLNIVRSAVLGLPKPVLNARRPPQAAYQVFA